jgi:hypothetical protein
MARLAGVFERATVNIVWRSSLIALAVACQRDRQLVHLEPSVPHAGEAPHTGTPLATDTFSFNRAAHGDAEHARFCGSAGVRPFLPRPAN